MHIPLATYRLQFNPLFGFKNASGIVSYLEQLGISDIYASPIFKAKKGSMHGYDVTDHNSLNKELGSAEEFEKLHKQLKEKMLFWLQDIVPNHMAYDSQNKMLMEVLENGEESPFHKFFDIKWDHPYEIMKGRVLVPFLGKFYAESLEKGEISLVFDEEGLATRYYDLRLPLNLKSYDRVLLNDIEALENNIGSNSPDLINYLGFVHSLKQSGTNSDRSFDQVGHSKKMIWNLYNSNESIKQFINSNLDYFNGKQDKSSLFKLDKLLMEQPYRLSFWKVASEEINYRRFFSINALISLKIEEKEVFEKTHELIFKLVKENKIHGLRIDHIDGLYDPKQYLKRLKEKLGDIYITIEKILAPYEDLPESWPVGSTTGYDFLNMVNGLFVASDNVSEITKIYYKFSGMHKPYEDLLCEKKKLIMGKHMAGDIDNLAQLMKRISADDIHGRDITLYGLKRALVEIMSLFPVYRTYINDLEYSEKDRHYIESTIEKAVEKSPGLTYEFNFIKKFFSIREGLAPEDRKNRLRFIMRFQQFTGPLMAKGLEDTTFYIFNRLLSLNDVGGSPEKFGISEGTFHNFNRKRALLYRYTMNSTSTHDTKRGEDVRARINVLSEIPAQWFVNLSTWAKMNRNKKTMLKGKRAPDKNDEYFIYQTLLGTYPFDDNSMQGFIARLKEYIIKAIREAKVHTAWIQPDTDYEEACQRFIEKIMKPSKNNKFLESFIPFQKRISFYGVFNSLSQTLIKLTSPGFPDIYQGTELWDLTLVDPDNRRSVDYEKRKADLKYIKESFEKDSAKLIKELLSSVKDGRIKMFLIWKTLNHRKANRIIFENGEYMPLKTEGRFKENVFSFARSYENLFELVIIPRFLTGIISENKYPLADVWEDTSLQLPLDGKIQFKNIFTGEKFKSSNKIQLKDILRNFPVAVISGKEL